MVRPKTNSEYMASLSQFAPEMSLSLSDVQEGKINEVLSTFIAPNVRIVRFLGSDTSQRRFLKIARYAIAVYIGQRDIEPQFDRGCARELLSATSDAIEIARAKLGEIARWRELSNYLRLLHREAVRKERQDPASEVIESSLTRTLKQQIQEVDDIDRIYSEFAPHQIRLLLMRLEAASSAAEQVTFKWGDAQRDQIAQWFTDELAFAWMSATGQYPTCSRPNPRLKKPSPFARLLATVNTELLDDDYRSPNNFLEYGIKSVQRIKATIPPDSFSD